MPDSKKAQIQIEDHFYDGNPKKAFTLVPEAGKGWRIKPIDSNQSIPVRVVRTSGDGETEVILQVGTTTSNLYDPNNLPLLHEGDEISVGMTNQFVVVRKKSGEWSLQSKDPSVEIKVSLPADSSS